MPVEWHTVGNPLLTTHNQSQTKQRKMYITLSSFRCKLHFFWPCPAPRPARLALRPAPHIHPTRRCQHIKRFVEVACPLPAVPRRPLAPQPHPAKTWTGRMGSAAHSHRKCPPKHYAKTWTGMLLVCTAALPTYKAARQKISVDSD